jgi:hypothetical protein
VGGSGNSGVPKPTYLGKHGIRFVFQPIKFSAFGRLLL